MNMRITCPDCRHDINSKHCKQACSEDTRWRNFKKAEEEMKRIKSHRVQIAIERIESGVVPSKESS